MTNINLLKIFINTVLEGSLSAAAAKLNIRQPAITMHIQSLEEYYGVRLFFRRGKGVELTPEGEIVFQQAKLLLQAIDRIELETFERLNGLKTNLTIGVGPLISEYLLPHVIASFKKQYPQIEVNVVPSQIDEIMKGVADYSFDIGFVGFPLGIGKNKLVLEEWADNDLVLIVPPCHQFCGKKTISPQHLTGQTFIWRKGVEDIKMSFRNRLKDAGADIHIEGSESSSTMELLSSVQAGLGISVVPRFAAQNALDMGMINTVRIEGVELRRKLYIVTNKVSSPFVVREFVKFAKQFSDQIL
jgi:DNA-binding transcriptional LysR family regulator